MDKNVKEDERKQRMCYATRIGRDAAKLE